MPFVMSTPEPRRLCPDEANVSAHMPTTEVNGVDPLIGARAGLFQGVSSRHYCEGPTAGRLWATWSNPDTVFIKDEVRVSVKDSAFDAYRVPPHITLRVALAGQNNAHPGATVIAQSAHGRAQVMLATTG